MIRLAFQYTLAVVTFLIVVHSSHAQKKEFSTSTNKTAVEKKAPKPYKILTSGKRITVQSKQHIKRILVWTSSGHRIVEQHELDVPSYAFTVAVDEKIFFMMLETDDGNRYTDKFGVQ